jgi:hypothetical protein
MKFVDIDLEEEVKRNQELLLEKYGGIYIFIWYTWSEKWATKMVYFF